MRVVFWLLLLTTPLAAQDAPVPILAALAPAQASALAPELAPEMADRILARPDRFTDMAADMINGHGSGGAVTKADIDRAIALDRAYFRTRALRPFLESDLDNDGSLARAETAARAGSLAANARARLMRQHDRADLDGDGTVSPPELRTHAEAEVARALPPEEEQMIRAILGFDADGDGAVTLPEITAALATVPEPG